MRIYYFKRLPGMVCLLMIAGAVSAQHNHHHHNGASNRQFIQNVEPQPLFAHALRVVEALSFIGSALPASTIREFRHMEHFPMTESTSLKVQELLDPFCIAAVEINPESRVKVMPGEAAPVLIQEGWVTYLVKVNNQAHITPELVPESPNTEALFHKSTFGPYAKEENRISPGQIENRFLQVVMYHGRPLRPNLSGLELEYVLIQFYTRAKGKREVNLGFNVGQGTQDIGFRNTIDILFDIKPAVKVVLDVKDEDGSPVTGSFIIKDGIDRFSGQEAMSYYPEDFRLSAAMTRNWKSLSKRKPVIPYPLKIN